MGRGLQIERTGRASAAPSLVSHIVRRIVLWALFITVIVTGLSYLAVQARSEGQTLDRLAEFVVQRGRAESQIFRAAEANLAQAERHFLDLYTDPLAFPSPDFDAYFFEAEDGAIRLRPEYFEGHRGADGTLRAGTSAFMGRKRPPLDDELKRRMVLAYELANRFGPAWVPKFANFHVSLPENALINHWPDEPWGTKADPDLDMTAGAVIRATLQEHNPERLPVWSGLYYDLTAGKWAVTYQRPVDLDGRHLVNPSHDILLDDLVARLIADHPAGGRNLILSRDGDLVAQPERMEALRQKQGVLNVTRMGDPELLAAYTALERHRVATGGADSGVIEEPALDAYIAFTRIEGPGWWFVTLYPRALVAAEANEAAGIVLALGLGLALLITLYVLHVLRGAVARPIAEMRSASERIAAGDYAAVADGALPLPDRREDEIGQLARAFRAMARRVGDANAHLERTVSARTEELRRANRKLERLSLRDGLTGAYNRRAFDTDMAEAARQAADGRRPAALLLCDLDHFKAYNDTYGHQAGDQVLSLVVSTIEQAVPDGRIYRYGGEEIAVLLDPERRDCLSGAEAIVGRIGALAIPHGASPFGRVTLSAGLAFAPLGGALSPDDFLRAADVQLYRAKKGGRNRLCADIGGAHDLPALSAA